MSADERREQIVDAAMVEFARGGLHGTSTETIAQRAGVSQPYLFRLFGTKKDLFVATARRCFDRVEETFRIAAESEPTNPLHAMGEAYMRLVSSRDMLLMQLQTYAACGDEDVRSEVGASFSDLFDYCERISGESREKITQFIAAGMLCNIALATGNEELVEEKAMHRSFGIHD
jgi:AcrR family transcriptional regulator